MEIKVLGSGCKNCKRLYDNTLEAVTKSGIQAQTHYITDMGEIAKTGVMKTPALIINNVIVAMGRVLSEEEIGLLLTKYQNSKSN